MTDGTLLRGEVLARAGGEFVGTGGSSGRSRPRSASGAIASRLPSRGAPAPAANLGEALQSGVAARHLSWESAVHESVRDLPPARRRGDPGAPGRPVHWLSGFRDRVDRLVRDWQGEIFDMVRSEGGNRRTNARVAAYGVNGIGLFLMLVSFAHTGGLTGAEVGIAGNLRPWRSASSGHLRRPGGP